MDSQTVLFDEREAAQRLGLSVATLRRRRLRRQPPVWAKLGSRVLYRKQDLESFVEANVVRLPPSHQDEKAAQP
jgi:hypothetical protein